MSAVPAARSRLLIDTNLLLLWFVGLFDRRRIQTFKRTMQFRDQDFVSLSRLIAAYGRPVTTTHVLTETSNLAGNLTGAAKLHCFRTFARQLEVLNELHVQSARIKNEPVFTRLGLTDTAIGILAAEHSLVVLTDDGALNNHLLSIGVQSYNLNHLRSQELIG